MTREEMLERAVRILVEAASPLRIILFGSEARGESGETSDFDLIIVERKVTSRRAEVVRLLEVLEPHGIPADIFVASEEFFEAWSRVPGNFLHKARMEGSIVYEDA
jgi:predicted nucleotidyltransferase